MNERYQESILAGLVEKLIDALMCEGMVSGQVLTSDGSANLYRTDQYTD